MSEPRRSPFTFPTLPVEPIDAGTNVLVTGPSLGGLRELLLQMLVGPPAEGTIVIATDANADQTLDAFESVGGDPNLPGVRVVDCVQEESEGGDRARTVTSPADLTGIGIEFSTHYESLHERGRGRVRTGIYTLSSILVYAEDFRSVFRFLHTLTGRIQSMDGLGVCAIDPGAQDERTMKSIAGTFDGQIELRKRDDECQIRTRGLPDQTAGWCSFTPTAPD